MIAELTTDGAGARGPRPVNLRTDLAGIADLVELCFQAELDAGGYAALREMRWLSRLGPALWLLDGLSRMVKGLSEGYVWIEDGRVVGNVSLYRADAGEPTWIIANVAVHPDYRRRGIARHLMHLTLDRAYRYGAHRVDLEVVHDNAPAINLYRDLGFYEQDTWVTWRRPRHLPPPPPPAPGIPIRSVRGATWRAVYELARSVRPHGLGWLRPVEPSLFQPSIWQGLGTFFGWAHRENYLVPDILDNGAAALAALTVQMSAGRNADRLTLMVCREQRGYLEEPLLAFGLRRLHERDKAVLIEHPLEDWAGTTVLESLHFEKRQTLMQMRYDFARH